jgi:hypothetical protein
MYNNFKHGGEGGSRTHEPGFARLPAFEAGSFDHSDTSPQQELHSSGDLIAGQRWLFLFLAAQDCLLQAGFNLCGLWRDHRAAMGAFSVTRSKAHRLKSLAIRSK